MSTDTSRISPTAHYTGYVWYRNGLSYDELATARGHRLYRLLWPLNAMYRRIARRPDLEMTLLARHRIIDHLLEQAIETGRVGQVIEIAGGLSPRGARFAHRYRERGLVYVEGDLPDMAADKRALLASADLRSANHHVVELNALVDDGPVSLAAVADDLLDDSRGTAIITEGLTGYFSPDELTGMWRRFSTVLRRYPYGAYWADLMLRCDAADVGADTFRRLLGLFAKGEVYLHDETPAEAEVVLREAGFTEAAVRPPSDFERVDVPARDERHLVRIIDALA